MTFLSFGLMDGRWTAALSGTGQFSEPSILESYYRRTLQTTVRRFGHLKPRPRRATVTLTSACPLRYALFNVSIITYVLPLCLLCISGYRARVTHGSLLNTLPMEPRTHGVFGM